MKNVLMVLLAMVLMLGAPALGEVKMGQALGRGSYAFCIATVAMDGDVIIGVCIEEFIMLHPETAVPVPEAELYINREGRVLGSKRANNELLSHRMRVRGGGTQDLITSYDAIEAFVTGKTIAELEAVIKGKVEEDAVDIVTSCTLVGTIDYLKVIIAAAKTI